MERQDKYKDAVEYAKMQIQKEMQRKQEIHHMYNEALSSYPSDRKPQYTQMLEDNNY